MDDIEQRTLHERVRRGRLYKDFLENDLTKECFADQEQYYFVGLKNEDKPEKALDLWHRLRAVGRVIEAASLVVQDGELAKEQLERDERFAEQGPASKPVIVKKKA